MISGLWNIKRNASIYIVEIRDLTRYSSMKRIKVDLQQIGQFKPLPIDLLTYWSICMHL